MPARIILDPDFRVSDVDPRLFGSFVEHVGRCVYTGIYEPEHPSADENGFRTDVKELTRELQTPLIRYPGGNFVSGYNWEDGVGPRADRPVRLDLAWKSRESNQVGTDEFMGWCRDVGAEPMMAVNLGTRGVAEAANLLEYCNHPGGTAWSDLRAKNGSPQPYDVKLWCLGNEMDGPWQTGHKTAYEYGRLAAETARAMRWVDPTIELVACGSSYSRMKTFAEWEETVLEECYDVVDYLSMHSYYEERPYYYQDAGDNRGSFLACATDMDRFIESVVATLDHSKAKGRHTKRLDIAFDEWNVWYHPPLDPHRPWEQAPALLENTFSVLDAVVVGNMLISLLKHADRVRIGCEAQLVNAIGVIMTDPGGTAWRQATYHPFALTSRHGRGTVLRPIVTSPNYDTSWFGPVPELDAVAVWHEDTGEITVFAVNRNQHSELPLEIDLRGLPGHSAVEHTYIADEDPDAVNTAAQPERVVPTRGPDSRVVDGKVSMALPALSWNMVRIMPAPSS